MCGLCSLAMGVKKRKKVDLSVFDTQNLSAQIIKQQSGFLGGKESVKSRLEQSTVISTERFKSQF